MCGIAGFTTAPGLAPARRVAEHAARARAMAAALAHRGPDDQRALLLDGAALAHARLAIVDRAGGAQPMRDPATGVALVFAGEIFNHVELRAELAPYPFRTRSDTEVLLAAFLRWGAGSLERLNGQFAFAIFDPRDRALWLARDRVGVLPLQYALGPGGLAFASEAKALVAAGFASGAVDPRGVKQALQLWAPLPPRTCLEGVRALPPATVARFADGALELRRWWALDLAAEPEPMDDAAAEERLGALLEDSVRLRLRADVPVAAYLSGGVDSSVVAAIAQRQLGGALSTFSVEFDDPAYDEGPFQRAVARALETRHHAVVAGGERVAGALPDVVAHAEQVLVRAAPAPLLALSRAVRDQGGRVVLTGEGSDEILLGYDLFAETRVRSFWARRPGSRLRPALLRRLHPYLPLRAQGDAVLRAVFGVGLEAPAAPAFSHLVRWTASARLWRLLSEEASAAAADEDPVAAAVATLPPGAAGWPPLARAQALEMETLLAGYLLAAQGDRMLLASGVEGRFPYLDHRLVDLAARLPLRQKLRGLVGKWVLRRYARARVPDAVAARPKFPYRAPPPRLLVGPGAPAWAREALAPESLRAARLFDPARAGRLVAKLSDPQAVASEVDAAGLTALVTGQLLARALRDVAPARAALERVAVEVA